MSKLPAVATKTVIGVIVAAIVVVGGYYLFFNGDSTKTVKAQFPEAVGVYVGTPVKVLGVNVGEVTDVSPGPQYVTVTMDYDSKYRIRASDARADEVANSLVSDRYIQLSTLIGKSDPAAALASGALIPESRTGSPAELDDIYAELDRLSLALGPNGANKGGKDYGALSVLLKVSAANLKGNGAAIGQSITKLAAAAQTLSDRKDGLFGTVKNLQKFTGALKQSDSQVRLFNTQLAQVAGDLAGERTDLGAALNQLGLALNAVNTFVKSNEAKFHKDLHGLRNITNILVRQKASLKETLAIAPIALANIVHAYSPALGALGTRSNLFSLTNVNVNPTQLVCSVVGKLAGGLSALPVNIGSVLDPVCKTGSAKSKQAASTAADTLLNGGVPPGVLVGSGK